VGRPAARLLVPNAGDLTWATVRLDDATLQSLPSQLAAVPDTLARAVLWTSLIDGVCLGSVDPRLLLRTFAAAWPEESNASVVNRISGVVVGRMIHQFLPPAEQDEATEQVAAAAARLLEHAAPGSTTALVAARRIAMASSDTALLQRWADGVGLPEGMATDTDLRWLVLRNLAASGAIGEPEIDAALELDRTLQGSLHALRAKASRPDEASKAWAWDQLTGDRGRSNYEMNELAAGFWTARDLDVVRPYVERYFTDVPQMAGRVGEDALARVATLGYPSPVVERATLELTEVALGRDGLSPAVRRALVDAGSELAEGVRSQERFGRG
jgi:aminopeptidase N